MPVTNRCRIALKEWAVVIDALASGRQAVLLRKGGIREKGGTFEPEHREFLLYPTAFHQNPEDLVPEARAGLARIAAEPRDPAVVTFECRAEVAEAFRVMDEARLAGLAPFHVLSPKAVASRFHYRKPGLHVLLLRVFRLPARVAVPYREAYEGCVSWVELDREVAVPVGTPAMEDQAFARLAEAVRRAVGGG